jgi:hypothetical protein
MGNLCQILCEERSPKSRSTAPLLAHFQKAPHPRFSKTRTRPTGKNEHRREPAAQENAAFQHSDTESDAIGHKMSPCAPPARIRAAKSRSRCTPKRRKRFRRVGDHPRDQRPPGHALQMAVSGAPYGTGNARVIRGDSYALIYTSNPLNQILVANILVDPSLPFSSLERFPIVPPVLGRGGFVAWWAHVITPIIRATVSLAGAPSRA